MSLTSIVKTISFYLNFVTYFDRWQLACEEDIAHIVVMPNVTKEKIDKFIEELIECKDKYGRMEAKRKDSPLSRLASKAWGGNVVAPVGDFKSS